MKQLRAAIEAGTYEVEPVKVAEAIMAWVSPTILERAMMEISVHRPPRPSEPPSTSP